MITNFQNYIPDQSRPGSTTTAFSIDSQDGNAKLATEKVNLVREQSTFGTWNVRTLNNDGKVHELVHALSTYSWNVIGLSETHWTGFGELTTDEGHKIWFSGNEKIHRQGVGFIVNKAYTNSVINCTPI